jgi:hypothetical protein
LTYGSSTLQSKQWGTRRDEDKNRLNYRKHRLTFEEAIELFQSGADYLEISIMSTPGPKTVSSLSDRFAAESC